MSQTTINQPQSKSSFDEQLTQFEERFNQYWGGGPMQAAYAVVDQMVRESDHTFTDEQRTELRGMALDGIKNDAMQLARRTQLGMDELDAINAIPDEFTRTIVLGDYREREEQLASIIETLPTFNIDVEALKAHFAPTQ